MAAMAAPINRPLSLKSTMPKAKTADFSKPNNPLSLAPIPELVPSNKCTLYSGGTADRLPNERKRASFVTEDMTNILDGSAKSTARRRFIESPSEDIDMFDKIFWSRPEQVREHVRQFFQVHENFWHNFKPTQEDVGFMRKAMKLKGSVGGHFGLYLSAIESRGSPEQVEKWFQHGRRMKHIGSYGQTELGHGSNVRGLRTTATYDKETEEFVLNTPDLLAMKWWPGGIGKVCTHAIVYAQLIIDGKEYGVHEFITQLRDENHRPLPGFVLGDNGVKLGDNANDTGFMLCHNVRIPRDRMLSRYQWVTPDGKYVKAKGARNDKAHYGTMLLLRARYIRGSGDVLAKGCTIVTRYSCVRRQGFVDSSRGISHLSEERTLLDHQVQRYRIFKQLALAYGMEFVGRWMTNRFVSFTSQESEASTADVDEAKEFSAITSGLKAISTQIALDGLEDLRKCCGGNGYLLSSGIALEVGDFCYQTTAEGDFILLYLQTARYIVRKLQDIKKGKQAVGPLTYLNVVGSPNFSLEAQRPRTANVSDDELADIDYLSNIYKFRALRSIVEVSEDFDATVASGKSFGESMNAHATALLEAVRHHCMYFILTLYIESVRAVQNDACRRVLEKLLNFFALSQIIDGQWADLLDTKFLRRARAAGLRSLDELRPEAVCLVDAFDFPDQVLNSVIGKKDGNVYEALFDAATRSSLNQTDPFLGYEEFLRPVLDLDRLRAGNKARYDDGHGKSESKL